MKIDAVISVEPTVRRGQAKQAEGKDTAGQATTGEKGTSFGERLHDVISGEKKEGRTKKVREEIPGQDANGARRNRGKAGETVEALALQEVLNLSTRAMREGDLGRLLVKGQAAEWALSTGLDRSGGEESQPLVLSKGFGTAGRIAEALPVMSLLSEAIPLAVNALKHVVGQVLEGNREGVSGGGKNLPVPVQNFLVTEMVGPEGDGKVQPAPGTNGGSGSGQAGPGQAVVSPAPAVVTSGAAEFWAARSGVVHSEALPQGLQQSMGARPADLARAMQMQMKLAIQGRGGVAHLELGMGTRGQIQMEMILQDGMASILIRTSNAVLSRELVQDLPALVRALESMGLKAESLEVETQGQTDTQGSENGFGSPQERARQAFEENVEDDVTHHALLSTSESHHGLIHIVT